MPKPPPPSSPFWKVWEVGTRGHIGIFRATGGRLGARMPGTRSPILLLHHVGAKSGKKRVSPLIYVPDGERVAIVASKGGVDKHPAWFHNLKANPDTVVELPREGRRSVRARGRRGRGARGAVGQGRRDLQAVRRVPDVHRAPDPGRRARSHVDRVLGAYRRLFDAAEARRLVLASAGARLAIGVFMLPLLLTVQEETGSFAAAGLVGGAFSLGVAGAAPVRGRLVDRRGLAAGAAGDGADQRLRARARRRVPRDRAGDGFALVAGASTPPLVAGMRLEWQRVLGAGDERLTQAYAFESGLQTAVFVAGPLLAGIGIAVVGARVTLVLSAVGLLLGTLGFAAVAGAVPSAERGRSPIRLPGVVTLVVATALADVGLGGVDVVVTAFAEERGRPELAGVLLALFCVGAVVGAVTYGARRWPGGVGRHLVVLMLAGAATLAVLAVPQTILVMAVVVVLAGPPGAAQWAAASLALDRASGGSAGAEAFTWLSAANGVGVAAGSVVCGAAVEAWGTEVAFLIAAGGPLLAAAVVAARRGTLAA